MLPADENVMPASSRAIYYGDGCFETLVSYKGKFLHFEDHFIRLQAGLEYLEMKSPFNEEKLQAEIYRLIEKNEMESEEAVIRVQCYREGGVGYFTISDESGFIISTRPIAPREAGINLKSVSVRAIPSVALERKVKLSNSINYIKAAQEARKKGGDDALMLTLDSHISETTIANLFWIKRDRIFTPSTDCDLLPGVTRSIIIKLIKKDLGLSLEEGKFSLQDMYEAEAAFCCNSVMELKSVSTLDNHTFEGAHSVLKKLCEEFQLYKKANLQDGR